MWIEYNPNPVGRSVGDCAVRAISKALDVSWETAYLMLLSNGYSMGDMPSSDGVWLTVLSDNTYIKLFRSLQNWRWYKDGNTARVFIHLLMKANITAADFEDVTIQRGEVATSYKSLASDLGLSVRNIRTALNHLKSTGEVTSRSTSKFTIISINNYEKYQGATNKMTNDRQASDKRPTSNRQQYNKNNKKENNQEYYSNDDFNLY